MSSDNRVMPFGSRADRVGIPEETLSTLVETQLVTSAFGERSVLIAGCLAVSLSTALCFLHTQALLYLIWSALFLAVTVVRLQVEAAFHRRGKITSIKVWKRRFIAGAWTSSLICGVCGGLSVNHTDARTQSLISTMLVCFVMGSAARNAYVPQAAIGSALIVELPIVVACIAARNLFDLVYGLFALLFIAAAISVTRRLYSQMILFLSADEKNARLMAELAEANSRLEETASTDGLTGIPNRRRFNDVLTREQARFQRLGIQFSVLMIDVDKFKLYNDHYGHISGDECLQRVVKTAVASLARSNDLFARYGGEEFAAILPETDEAGAAELAERIRARIELLGIPHAAVPGGIVTVSIGVATAQGTRGDTDLIRRADSALYSAKRAGRNHVGVARTDDHRVESNEAQVS